MKSLLISSVFLVLVGCGSEKPLTDTWSKYASAKFKWQNELAELLLKHAPEHKEIINRQRNLQIAQFKP